MCFNFCGVYILRICNFHVFRIFKFAVAGYIGVEIFAGETFADIRSESVYHNSMRQLVQNLLDSLDSFEDVIVLNGDLHPRISHLHH